MWQLWQWQTTAAIDGRGRRSRPESGVRRQEGAGTFRCTRGGWDWSCPGGSTSARVSARRRYWLTVFIAHGGRRSRSPGQDTGPGACVVPVGLFSSTTAVRETHCHQCWVECRFGLEPAAALAAKLNLVCELNSPHVGLLLGLRPLATETPGPIELPARYSSCPLLERYPNFPSPSPSSLPSPSPLPLPSPSHSPSPLPSPLNLLVPDLLLYFTLPSFAS